MPSSTGPKHWILWGVLVVALIALIIDVVDGYHPKTLTTLGLVVGVSGVLLVRLTQKRAFNWLAIAGFLLCIGSATYRLARHQGWL